ncbi:hypothetical protein Bca4012_083529 [Brassica carinata]
MSHYNKLAEVVYNNRLTAWRFKVKILRIHSTLASYVESNQRNWSYIIADEDGTKTEMKIYALSEERYIGLEKQEGNWVEIFLCIHQIPHIIPQNYPIDTMGVVFNAIFYFEDPGRRNVVFSLGTTCESQIKCVATGDHAWAFRDGFENKIGRGEVIVVLKMWRLETEGGLSNFRFNLDMPEVEEFRQSLVSSDPYVQRHETIRPF